MPVWAEAHEKVVGLDVSVQNRVRVEEFESSELYERGVSGETGGKGEKTDELVGEHEDGLDTKRLPAVGEEIFETGSQEFDDEDVPVALGAKEPYVRDTRNPGPRRPGWG